MNAYTGFDETVYMLQVPTEKPEVLDRSFLILEDWAHAQTLDPAEIDKERGVVKEEWRLRRGAFARMQDKQFPVMLKGSRYAERLPIGKPEIIDTFKHERLRQFYQQWYRPDLMTVIAVGEVEDDRRGGLVQLARFVPSDRLLAAGLIPFLPGDLVKATLAALAFPAAWRWARSRGGATGA